MLGKPTLRLSFVSDKDMLSQLKDPSLPKELTAMFQPLYCVLCKMHLNSASNAKLHYLSKNHHKKIKNYLIDHAKKTGEPLHKRARTVVKAPVPVSNFFNFYILVNKIITIRIKIRFLSSCLLNHRSHLF